MARGTWRLFWLFVLGFHAVAAFAWWWLMPRGFLVTHPRFWSNGVAPLVFLAVVLTAVIGSRCQQEHLLRSMLAAFPAAWAGMGLMSRFVFPITFARLFLVPLLGALLMAAALIRTFRVRPDWPLAIVVILAALIGAGLPMAERSPPPNTRPRNIPMPEPIAGSDFPDRPIAPGVFVHAGEGSMTVRANRLNIHIQPLLRFLSQSPDGAPTILVPKSLRERPDLRLVSSLQRENGFALRYRADHEATLLVHSDQRGRSIALESMARLDRPIDSHLNSYSDLQVSGHQRLSLAFSPCPDQRIEVRPADYPIGRPLRLAYLDSSERFHVVEASSGEKGPFRELARGRLARSEALSITLLDNDAPVAILRLDDCPSQLDTALSPTAGWGLPVNAIEFRLDGDSPGSPAEIFLTLASTSVGRGWECVGHSAGTYRNRLTIEILDRF